MANPLWHEGRALAHQIERLGFESQLGLVIMSDSSSRSCLFGSFVHVRLFSKKDRNELTCPHPQPSFFFNSVECDSVRVSYLASRITPLVRACPTKVDMALVFFPNGIVQILPALS